MDKFHRNLQSVKHILAIDYLLKISTKCLENASFITETKDQ